MSLFRSHCLSISLIITLTRRYPACQRQQWWSAGGSQALIVIGGRPLGETGRDWRFSMDTGPVGSTIDELLMM